MHGNHSWRISPDGLCRSVRTTEFPSIPPHGGGLCRASSSPAPKKSWAPEFKDDRPSLERGRCHPGWVSGRINRSAVPARDGVRCGYISSSGEASLSLHVQSFTQVFAPCAFPGNGQVVDPATRDTSGSNLTKNGVVFLQSCKHDQSAVRRARPFIKVASPGSLHPGDRAKPTEATPSQS